VSLPSFSGFSVAVSYPGEPVLAWAVAPVSGPSACCWACGAVAGVYSLVPFAGSGRVEFYCGSCLAGYYGSPSPEEVAAGAAFALVAPRS